MISREYKIVSLPLQKPFPTSKGKITQRRLIWLKQETDFASEPTLFSEIATLPDFGSESIDEAMDFLQSVDLTSPAIDVPSNLPATEFAFSCLHRQPTAHRTHSAGLASLHDLFCNAQNASDLWEYSIIKLKIGMEPARVEVEKFNSILAFTPDNVRFRLDPNESWTRKDADIWNTNIFSRSPQRIAFVEDPFHPKLMNDSDLISYSETVDFAIALDERLRNREALDFFTNARWNGYFVIKPSLFGNPQVWLKKVKPFADKVVLSSAFESPIGFSHLISLARHFPNQFHGFGTAHYFQNPLPELLGPSLSSPSTETIFELWKNV